MIMIIIPNELFLLDFFFIKTTISRIMDYFLAVVTWGVSDEIRSVSNKAIKYYPKE